MKSFEAKVMVSTTDHRDLTLKDAWGSGGGLKTGLRNAGFEDGDEVTIVLRSELASLLSRSDDSGRVERVRKAIADWRSSWSGLGLREDAVDEIVRVMLAAANGR